MTAFYFMQFKCLLGLSLSKQFIEHTHLDITWYQRNKRAGSGYLKNSGATATAICAANFDIRCIESDWKIGRSQPAIQQLASGFGYTYFLKI